jgi:osmotically-inducible protein OsmY/DNA-directed RNA polymerase subunit RPC12/RpoP
MATTQYKCLNFAACNKALEREVIEIEDGEELICPECESKLLPVKEKKPSGPPKWLIPLVVLLCVAGLAIWLLIPSPKPKPSAPTATNKGITTQPPSPSQTSPAPPEACTDSQLATTIKERLAHDEDLKGNAIQIDVANRTVILSGTVENDLARNYAADIAHQTGCPIVSVVNDLKLGLPDNTIAIQIRQSFAKDSSLKSQPIQVEVSHGNVVLSGYVTESIARTVAADDASHVAGVITVTNNLLVHPSSSPSSVQGHQSSTPQPTTTTVAPNLSGLWTGTFQTCAQGQSAIRVQITDAAPDDITASIEITMPSGGPGTFMTHGVLNTMNSFLALQFSGWQHQPPGLTMGNIGGYITYNNQKPDSFSGVIKSPGCGQISLKKQ